MMKNYVVCLFSECPVGPDIFLTPAKYRIESCDGVVLFKVSSWSRKLECNFFSIIHLNGHNF